MTDKEIKKALECCKPNNDEGCLHCPLSNVHVKECTDILLSESIALINRQQAKIERLEYEIMKTKLEKHLLNETVEEIKSEAIKEFAERLKEKEHTQPIFDTYCGNKYMGDVSKVYVADIDNLVKEMVGEQE